MSLYDINTKTFANNNIPPDKRKPKILATIYSLLAPMQDNSDAFKLYRGGDVRSRWSKGATYSIGDEVMYLGKNYRSLQNGNNNKQPLINPLFWVVFNPSAIGSDERVRYQPNKLIFEYALNRYFGTVFRQPPLVSDIYITDTAYYNPSFIVGGIESNSSITYADRSDGYVFNDYFVQLPYSFIIKIPVVLYHDISDSFDPVYQFANSITAAGKTFLVQTY